MSITYQYYQQDARQTLVKYLNWSDIDEEEEGQFEDLQTYLTHHNTYQESQNICKEYRKRLLDLDDERYYRDIDHAYET